MRRIIISLAALAVLAACGHRGPLYIPGKPGDPAYDRDHRSDATVAPPGNSTLPSNPAPVIPAPVDDSKANGGNGTR